MSQEDDLLQCLIAEEPGEWRTEVHYNHYGDRGVVDGVCETESAVTLYELKSASAVRNATGANEIIRQVNRHREYYFEAHPTRKKQSLRLVFEVSQTTWDHIKSNQELYVNLSEQSKQSNVPCWVIMLRRDGHMLDPCHPRVGRHTDRWEEQLGWHDGFFSGTGVEP